MLKEKPRQEDRRKVTATLKAVHRRDLNSREQNTAAEALVSMANLNKKLKYHRRRNIHSRSTIEANRKVIYKELKEHTTSNVH